MGEKLDMSWQARELGIDLDKLQRERPAGSWVMIGSAAKAHNVCRNTVYRAIIAGKVQGIKEDGLWFVLAEDCHRLWGHAA